MMTKAALMILALIAATPQGQQGDGKPAPAPTPTATDAPPGRVRAVTVFGDDPCPKPASADEIVVCGRLSENERYRIPKEFRDDGRGADAPSASWASRVRDVDAVNRVSLPGSCSVVGSYGQSGCTQQFIKIWQAERADELRKASAIP